MSIRNLKDNSKKPWICEYYPQGREGKRIRKKFATKGEAAAFECFTMNEVEDKPWLGDKPDHRRLMDLINLWYSLYGRTLSKGKYIHNKFMHMVNAMGNPVASSFTAKLYADFRSKRMAGELNFVDRRWQKGAPSIATLNSELARLKPYSVS